MLNKTIHYILLIIMIVYCSSAYAQTDTLPPPVPENGLSCKDKVAHIFKTDQYDRTDYMLDTANFDISVFNRRDSIRLSRIIELDRSGCIHDYESLRKAAFVYLHSGGFNMPDDSIYYKRAMELAEMASKKAGDSLERIKANNIRKLASNRYLSEKDTTETEPISYGTITDTTDLEYFISPEKLDSLKADFKREAKVQLDSLGMHMTDEKLDEIADESVELIRKQMQAIIHSTRKKAKKEMKKQKAKEIPKF